jgi:hypothetical protein
LVRVLRAEVSQHWVRDIFPAVPLTSVSVIEQLAELRHILIVPP